MQGTRIRQKAKGQQVRLLLWSPSSRPSLLSRDQTCPSSPSPAPGVFSQHISGPRKERACQNQGSVFNIIMTAVKTVIITQNQREERRTSVGQVWGEETDPIFLSTITGGYRNPLISTLEAQPAETWGPNQGSLDTRSWVWGGGVTLESGSVPQVQSLGIVCVSPHPRGSHICSLPAVCPSGVPNV